MAHLCVFGSDAMHNRWKARSNSKEVHLCGLGEKRKVLRLCTWEMIFSWDVVFNEEEYGGLESDDATRYVELELSSDDDPPTTLESQPEEVNHHDIATDRFCTR